MSKDKEDLQSEPTTVEPEGEVLQSTEEAPPPPEYITRDVFESEVNRRMEDARRQIQSVADKEIAKVKRESRMAIREAQDASSRSRFFEQQYRSTLTQEDLARMPYYQPQARSKEDILLELGVTDVDAANPELDWAEDVKDGIVGRFRLMASVNRIRDKTLKESEKEVVEEVPEKKEPEKPKAPPPQSPPVETGPKGKAARKWTREQLSDLQKTGGLKSLSRDERKELDDAIARGELE